MATLATASPAVSNDVQLWTVGRVEAPINEDWGGQLLARFRFDDDVSRAKDFMLRAQPHRQLGPFDAGVGYDYLYSYVNESTIEHRLFQQAEYRWQPSPLSRLSMKNRVRADERFHADADGVILRLRYRLRFDYRVGSRWYLAIHDEVFANVNDRGSGPVQGFEQNRLRTTIGRFIASGIRGEVGYDWQLSDGRDRDVINRHVFFVNVFAAPEQYREGRGD